MHLKRTAMFACGAAAVATWLAAAATSGVRSQAPAPARDVPPAEADVDLAAEVARLHERLTPAATPARPGRDLFRFATPRPKRIAAAERPAALVEPAAPAVQPTPARPAVKLAGIASDGPADATVRTAILSTQGQLFLAKEGDAVTARYKVLRISADVVELLDMVDNSTLRLPLR